MKKNDGQDNTMGILSLIFGISGFVFMFFVPLIFNVLAIIFGGIGMSKNQKFSVAGLVLGLVGIAAYIIVAFFLVFMMAIFI